MGLFKGASPNAAALDVLGRPYEYCALNNNVTSYTTTTANTAYSYTWNSMVSTGPGLSSTMWSSGTPTRIIMPTAGCYVVEVKVPFSVSAANVMAQFWLGQNGTGYTIALQTLRPASTSMMSTTVFGMAWASAGDYLTFLYQSDAGNGLTVSSGYWINPFISVRRVS